MSVQSPGGAAPGGASSPNVSVKELRRGGVRRLNNRPLLVVSGFGLLALIVITLVMMGRSGSASKLGHDEENKKHSAMSQAAPLLGTLGEGTEVAAQARPAATLVDPSAPPLPPGSAGAAAAPPMTPAQAAAASRASARAQRSSEIQTARTAAFMEALKAPSAMASASRGDHQVSRSQGAQSGGELTDADKRVALSDLMARQAAAGQQPSAAEVAEMSRLNGGETSAEGAPSPNAVYAKFDGKAGENRWRSSGAMDPPVNRFELRAGFVIPGVLISGISSELPGQIVAQVSQNVFDTATGRELLIPQGTRLVGSYASNASYGQARILIAWQRLVFPDGKALDIGSMPGSDSAGYSGFTDQVNNHYRRIFGSALLLSLIGAGAQVGQPQTSTVGGTTSISQALSASLAQELGQTATQLIQKNLSIAPTLKIRPGYRFNVVVTKDLVFASTYKAFDY
jgi:type IV secretory pathway VirB10-like protein